jgi:diguanylate cyclase (GGDEF)-like protein/PAS domain S-box-containing protein
MHEKTDAVRYRIFRIAVWFAPFFYIIDAAARSWSPSDLQGFLTHLLRPSPAEIAVRLITIAVWLVFSWLLIYLAGPSPAGAPTAPSRLERRILDASPDPVIIGSASWEIVDCNSAATALYGYDREMFIGKPVWFFTDSEPSGAATGNWDRLALLEPVEGEVRLRCSDGSSILVWRKGVPLRSSSGSFSGFVFFDCDITRKKQELEALRLSRDLLADLVEKAKDIIFRLDADGKITFVNPAFEAVTGLKRSDWVGKPLGALLVPDDLPAFTQRLRSLAAGHGERVLTVRLKSKRDDEITVEISLIPEYRDRVLTGIFGVARDMTTRKRSEEELRARHYEVSTLHRISEIAASAGSLDAVFDRILAEVSAATGFPLVLVELYDPNRGVTSLRAAKGIPLESPQEFVAVPVTESLSGMVARTGKTAVDLRADEAQKYKNPILNRVQVKTFISVPLQVEGAVIGVISLGHPQAVPVDEPRIRWTETLARYVASLIARKQTEEQLLLKSESLQKANEELEKSKAALQELALRDPLTDLYNRREMNHILAGEMERAKRYNRTVNLALMDLDHFKDVNDTYGHQAGDDALRSLARFIQENIRAVDRPCRYGGEEFAVVIPEVSLREAAEMAERLRRLVEQTAFRVRRGSGEPIDLRLTLSIGVASYPEHARTVNALIAACDAALYEAKASGRNRVVIGRPSAPQ